MSAVEGVSGTSGAAPEDRDDIEDQSELKVASEDECLPQVIATTGNDLLIQHLSQANTNLQQALGNEQSARSEDRFIAFVLILILFDIIVLGNLANAAVPIVVLVLEVLVLAVLSRRMGIKRTAAIVDRLMTGITGEVKVDK